MTLDLELIADALPQQVAAVNSAGIVVYANPAFVLRYGVMQSLLGKRLENVIDAELAREIAPAIKQAQAGEKVELIQSFPMPDAGRAWSTTFVPTPGGGYIYLSEYPGSGYEHPPRVNGLEKRLQAFLEFAPIGMIFSTVDGGILEANDTFLKMIGYSREELKNGELRWDTLTPPEFIERDIEAIAEAKKTGFSRTYEKDYIKKTGERIHILIGFILIGQVRDEGVAFVADLTALKNAEEEVRRLNMELEERVATRTAELEIANRELEAFCYSVSHDLRAPLRSIDGFAYALDQDFGSKLDAEAIDFIIRIRNSVKRMDELISALLGLSRLTRVELDLKEVNLSALAQATTLGLEESHRHRNIKFDIQPDLTVKADMRLMRIVLENLLGNAVKFTGRQEFAIIRFGRESTSGAYYVEDNGVGFEASDVSKLFQPFERLHSPREFNGSGIGLTTVQRIVRRHGGKIWAVGATDKGATFFFTLDA
jgi:PAS domain S-box-containing protein